LLALLQELRLINVFQAEQQLIQALGLIDQSRIGTITDDKVLHILTTGDATLAHLKLANVPFQFIIRPGQSSYIVTGEEAPPKAAKDAVDMGRDRSVFRVSRLVSDQVNQVSRNGLSDFGAGSTWVTVWIEQLFQINQPLPLPPIALNLVGKGLATAGQGDQAPQQNVVTFF
jgi:hypothetical protein